MKDKQQIAIDKMQEFMSLLTPEQVKAYNDAVNATNEAKAEKEEESFYVTNAVNIYNFPELCDSKHPDYLSAVERAIIVAICGKMSIIDLNNVYNSNCITLNKNMINIIAEKNNIASKTVRNCITKLINYGIIRKISNNTCRYMINPYLFTKGNSRTVKKFIESDYIKGWFFPGSDYREKEKKEEKRKNRIKKKENSTIIMIDTANGCVLKEGVI